MAENLEIGKKNYGQLDNCYDELNRSFANDVCDLIKFRIS